VLAHVIFSIDTKCINRIKRRDSFDYILKCAHLATQTIMLDFFDVNL